MSNQQVSSVADVFQALWAIEPARRRTEFARLYGDNPPLWSEVESLLHHAEAAVEGNYFPPPPLAEAKAEQSTPAEHLLPGTRVGPFELIRQLGRGGMGSVHLAKRIKGYDQLVAIKFIGGEVDEALRKRFQAERQLLAKLGHSSIVHLLGGDATEDGTPYLVMEYVDGEPLDVYCDEESATVRDKVRLLLDVARAVAYAHGKGILHRDIKPRNILVTAEGIPKVTDFGLAKSICQGEQDSTAHGGILGTPAFMAPEQVRGDNSPPTPAIDCYGLGATLYTLLTGRPPFRGETVMDTYWQITNEEPVPPGRLHKGLARDLETICLHCLKKDPTRRYPDVTALAGDLEAFLEGRPITARPIGPVERGWRWCKRRPGLAAALASLLVVILSSLVGLSWLWAVAQGQRDRAEANLSRVIDGVDRWYTRIADRPELRRDDLAPLRRELFEAARDEVERLSREVGANPRLRGQHARTTAAIARLLNALGDTELALAQARAAVEEAGRLVEEEPHSVESRKNLLAAIQQSLLIESDQARADSMFRRAGEIYENLGRSAARDELRDLEAQILLNTYNMAVRKLDAGHMDEAIKLVRRACELGERQVEEGLPAASSIRATAAAYSHLCDLESAQGRRREAEAAALRATEILRRRVEEGLQDVIAVHDYRIALEQVEGYLGDWGRHEEAAARAEEVCRLLEAAIAVNRPAYERLDLSRSLLEGYGRLIELRRGDVPPTGGGGSTQAKRAAPHEVEAVCQKTCELARGLRVVLPADADIDYLAAEASFERYRLVRARGGRLEEMKAHLAEACDMFRSGAKKRPDERRNRELEASAELKRLEGEKAVSSRHGAGEGQ